MPLANSISLNNPALLARAVSGSGLSNLTTFTVDGTPQTNGATVNLDNGTSSVTIAATNGGSISSLTGDSGLATGDNPCTFTVTAEDGVTTLDVTINLHVVNVGFAEVTEVTVVGDGGGSLHNTNTRIYKVGNVQVAVVLDGGARKQKTQFDFTGLTFLDFITGSDGKYVVAQDATTPYALWFNFGTETAPSPGGGFTLVKVDISPLGALADIASGLLAALIGLGFTDSGSSGAVVIVEDATTGPRFPGSTGTSGVAVDILATGRAAASAIGGVTTIFATIADNQTQDDIAVNYAAALNDSGWWTADGMMGGGLVVVTDNAVGPRTDASNVSSGFSISITQQGADPS